MFRTTGFRLALWYSTIFITSTVLLFMVVFFPLRRVILEKDRNMTLAKLKEYALQEQRGGLGVMLDEIRLEDAHNRQSGFFVRVVDRDGHDLHLTLPGPWQSRTARLPPVSDSAEWILLPAPMDGHVLEIASQRLTGGALLQIGKSSEESQKLLANFRRIFAGVMLPVIVIGFAGGFFLAFRALRPLRDLIQTLRSIDTGRLEARVPSSQTDDEFDELIRLFNAMLEKIALLITGMKGALDNVAHDLRTPVTRMRAGIETALQAKADGEPLREALMDCAEESERIMTMLNTLMDISEAETGVMRLERETVDLAGLLGEVVEFYHYVAEENAIDLGLTCQAGLLVRADRNRMRQVVANLLDNAIKFTPAGGWVKINARRQGQEVLLEVEDSGCGIEADDLPRIFDRLYRADRDRSRRGLGLGLSLVQAVVKAHHGHIEVASTPGHGAHFTIFWPL